MGFLFTPVLSVFSRINFKGKFLAVGVLLIPLFIALYLGSQRLSNDIAVVRSEREGVVYIDSLFAILNSALWSHAMCKK